MRLEKYPINGIGKKWEKIGSRYGIEGFPKTYNRGDFLEFVCATHHNLNWKKLPVKWWEGSDLQELEASVKSAHFSLGEGILGDTYEEKKRYFLENTVSTTFIYMMIDKSGENALEWIMTKAEFSDFLDLATKVERGEIRGQRADTYYEMVLKGWL